LGTESAQGMGCYLYAIYESGDVDLGDLDALDPNHPLGAVTRGRMAAIVSDLPLAVLRGLEDEPPVEESRLAQLARRHDAVVERVFRQRPVLPLRLGTVVHDRTAVAKLLDDAAPRLEQELDRVRGRSEWQVRVANRVPHEQKTVEQHASRATGTDYLKARAAAQRTRDESLARLQAGLQEMEVVGDEAAEVSEPIRWLAGDTFSATAYLVPVEREEAFRIAIEEQATNLLELGAKVEICGPFPPYHFINLKLTSQPG
jgi:Gas vesicle synthesis protein GvpL/GvpF